MKKWISVALATFCTVSFAEDAALEDMDKLISEAKNPTFKQHIICTREANFIIAGDPQKCVKAGDMLLEMSTKATKNSLLRCEFFGANEEKCKLKHQNAYQMTDKEFFNKYIAFHYNNAGVMYSGRALYEKEFTMYKKALEYNPNDDLAHINLGISYYHGRGVAMDKNKAYYHWNIAAKQGNQQATINLGVLCSESPWACK